MRRGEKMSYQVAVSGGDKAQRYAELLPQLQALITSEQDQIASLANVSAALNACFDWLWVGFYLVKGRQLVLGPFQGPLACTRIDFGKGVCGAAWQQGRTLLVQDVDAFPGHIACSSLARSEVVVPVFDSQGVVKAVLDIDSSRLGEYDEVDRAALEQLATWLTPRFD